jgi:hypothetical protein
MEQLLADQASMILNAMDERLSQQEKRSNIRLEKDGRAVRKEARRIDQDS